LPVVEYVRHAALIVAAAELTPLSIAEPPGSGGCIRERCRR
jgi:hypothetical protein